MQSSRRMTLVMLVVAVGAVACGGSEAVDDSAAASIAPTAEPAATTPPRSDPLPTDVAVTDVPRTDPPSTDVPTSEPVTSDPENVASPLGDPFAIERTSMRELLGRLPEAVRDDNPDDRFLEISLGDFDAASELAGLTRPAVTDVDASGQWLFDLFDRGLSLDGPRVVAPAGWSRTSEEFADLVGYSPFAIRTFAMANAGQGAISVISGDLPLSPDLIDIGNGVVSLGEGEDHTNGLDNVTAASPDGRPVRFAARGDLVAGSYVTPVVEAWASGEAPTLADDGLLASLADALDSFGAVSAQMMAGSFSPPPGAWDDVPGEPAPPISVPFDAVGIGTSAVDGRLATAIVYAFADDELAESARAEIEDHWRNDILISTGQVPVSEVVYVRSVVQEGSTVVVVALPTEKTGSRNFAYELLLRGEPLFSHV